MNAVVASCLIFFFTGIHMQSRKCIVTPERLLEPLFSEDVEELSQRANNARALLIKKNTIPKEKIT